MPVRGAAQADFRQWPNVSIATSLPNVSGSPTQISALAVGDQCFVMGSGLMYVCTVATLGAAVWRQDNEVLWAWNGLDTTQFGPKVDLGFGPNTAGLTIGTTAGGPNGTLLRVASTEIDAGAVGFPILATLPRRYVIEIEYWRIAFTDSTVFGTNAVGVITHGNPTLTNFFSWLGFNCDVANPDEQYLSQFSVSAGAPFGPAYVFNGTPWARYQVGPTATATPTGMRVAFTVENQVPCAADPQLAMRVVGSGYHDATGQLALEVYGTTAGVTPGTYPAGWNGLTLNTAGLIAGNFGVTTSWAADIVGLRILKHPADR